jgi:hypothetical protein
MAALLIFTRPLEVISRALLEMAEVQKSGYFQMSKPISVKVGIANISGGS